MRKSRSGDYGLITPTFGMCTTRMALRCCMWEDGDAVFPSGRMARGRTEVEIAETRNHSTGNKQSHTMRTIQTIRFITPDVALVDGSVEITGMVDASGQILPARQGLMTMLFVKKQERWWIAAARAMVPTSGASTVPQQATSHVERNVVYGMYSGLSLLMDVHYPQNPNGYGIIFIAGSAFYAPLSYDDT